MWPMSLVNAITLKKMSDIDHLRQSIVDILTTPVGSRVMLRDYGSRLPRLIDRNISPDLLVDIYYETADALLKWEPRIRVSRVQADISAVAQGKLTLSVIGFYVPLGKIITVDGINLSPLLSNG